MALTIVRAAMISQSAAGYLAEGRKARSASRQRGRKRHGSKATKGDQALGTSLELGIIGGS